MSKFSAFPLDDQLVLLAQIGLAAVLGGIIGWERDRAGKQAGIRTHVLVCTASAFATGLGELVIGRNGLGDGTRTLHGVLTGMGFIGAGMIWTAKNRHGPTGLTSASTVMLVAVIGAACGLGAPVVAAATTVLALATLMGITILDRPGRDTADAAPAAGAEAAGGPSRARERPSS